MTPRAAPEAVHMLSALTLSVLLRAARLQVSTAQRGGHGAAGASGAKWRCGARKCDKIA